MAKGATATANGANGHANGDGHANGNGHANGDATTTAAAADAPTKATNPLLRALNGFHYLFFAQSFQLHRVFGLLYLIQFVLASWLWYFRYERFLNSWLIVTLPVSGSLQALIAIYTFTFLPKKQVDGGYFSYKKGNRQGTISYDFVKENFFFATILAFQWLYYNDKLYPLWTNYLWPLEYIFVFLPYVMRRIFPKQFPKTSFRASTFNMIDKDTGKFIDGQQFYWAMLMVTKTFYVWAKHYLGFFLNYLRFIEGTKIDYETVRWIYLIEITSCFATTIAIFLHTLRFKHYVDPRVSMATYVTSYLCTFIGYVRIFFLFVTYWKLALVCAVGAAINVAHNLSFDFYQIGVMLVLHCVYRQPELLAYLTS